MIGMNDWYPSHHILPRRYWENTDLCCRESARATYIRKQSVERYMKNIYPGYAPIIAKGEIGTLDGFRIIQNDY